MRMDRVRLAMIIVLCLFSLSPLFATNGPAPLLRARSSAAAIDLGRADPSVAVDDALISIPLTADGEMRLQMLLHDQQDRTSPRYHQWLTPEEFADQFGPSRAQLDAVVSAVRSQGLRPSEVAKSRTWVRVSGTAGTFERSSRRTFTACRRIRC